MALIGLVGGRYTAMKDSDDVRLFQYGYADDLAQSNTTLVSAVAAVSGVSVVPIPPSGQAVPLVSGTDVLVMLSGLNITDGASNFCTIRATFANGEQVDRTIWFVREEH